MEAENASSLGAEALLAHAGWMRSLARRLVADPERAEDVVQQALLAAIERPPAHAGSVRGWLGRVVANTARQLGRGESRRARRERASARGEALPSTAELVLEAELQREVVSAILGLAEPYRSTILLRFHRDLLPKRIAELQGVPAATVRSRLSRALAELRSELDRRYGGDRRAWSAALVPLVRDGSGAGAAGLVAGIVALSVKAKLALAAAGLAGALLLAWALRPEPPAPPPGPDLAVAKPALAPAERAEETAAVEQAEVPAAAASMEREVVEARAAKPALARIEAPHEPDAYLVIQAVAAGFQTSSRDPVVPDREIELQLSWTTELFGTVVDDETDAPIAGVAVSCWASKVTSDARGRYRLADVVVGRRIEVSARKEGYAPLDTNLVLGEPVPIEHEIRLQAGTPLRLEVFDEHTGEPVRGAEVVRGHDDALGTTDGEGALTVWIAEGTDLDLDVHAAGYADFGWTWEVEDTGILAAPRIPMKGLAWIEGLVTDEEGRPLAGCWMYASNPDAPSPLRMPHGEQAVFELPGYVRWEVPDDLERGGGEDGSFTVPVIPVETPYSLGCGQGDHVTTYVGPLLLREPGERVWLDVVLRKGATVRGHVLYNGAPWNEGEVLYQDESGKLGGFVQPEADGRYEMEDVPAGRVKILLRQRWRDVVEPVELEVEAGEEYEHDFSWEEELATITGRVTDARGEPVSGLDVMAWDFDVFRRFSAESASDGTYELEVAPGRSYLVEAIRRPHGASRSDVPAGAEGIDLVLPDVGCLSLRLVDAATGEPVTTGESSLWGLAWRESGAEVFRTVREEVDHDGRVELVLPVGIVDLAFHLTDDGYVPRQVHGIAVTLEGNDEPLVVELERGAGLKLAFEGEESTDAFRGHLLFLLHDSQLASLRGPFPAQGGPSNHRINGIDMWMGEPGLLYQMLELDHTGLAVLHGLRPGRHALSAFPDDFVFEPASFELPAPDPGGGKPTVTIRWRSR